jgi:transmembrane sensor
VKIEELINKVISGNATPLETKQLNDLLAVSEENQKLFDEQQLVWNVVGASKKQTEVDVDLAWSKFLNSKEQISEKPTRILYKIAAILIVLLTAGSIGSYIFLNNQNKSFTFIAKEITPKTKEINSNKNTRLNNQTEVTSSKSYFSKIKQNERENDAFLEYVLLDSSTVKLENKSALTFLEYSPNHSRVASLVGAGVFNIKSSSQLFILETDDIVIHVEGTKFNVSSATTENPYVEIYVEEGAMDVYDKQNMDNSVSLSAGQKYTFNTITRTFKAIDSLTKEKSKWRRFWNKFNKK